MSNTCIDWPVYCEISSHFNVPRRNLPTLTKPYETRSLISFPGIFFFFLSFKRVKIAWRKNIKFFICGEHSEYFHIVELDAFVRNVILSI